MKNITLNGLAIRLNEYKIMWMSISHCFQGLSIMQLFNTHSFGIKIVSETKCNKTAIKNRMPKECIMALKISYCLKPQHVNMRTLPCAVFQGIF